MGEELKSEEREDLKRQTLTDRKRVAWLQRLRYSVLSLRMSSQRFLGVGCYGSVMKPS